jgi:GT2 family glycosyltransferase
MSVPTVDVVVLTWDDEESMRSAVASALNSVGVEIRVAVVDNGSVTPARVPPDGRVRLLRNEANRGVAGGRNQGAAVGEAPYLCFLDSDAELEPDCLAALAAPLESDRSVALSAPVFAGQAPEASAGRAPTMARKVARGLGLTSTYAPMASRLEAASGSQLWDIEIAIGACLLVRRCTFDEAGGFDEQFFYGPEDIELCRRLSARRWRLVQVPGARCHHPPRRRNRNLFTRRGLAHAGALWRYYRLRPDVPPGQGGRQ